MNIYLLHGKNEFLRSEGVRAAIAASEIPKDLLAFNSETLVPPTTFQQFRAATSVIPFMGDKRLVMVHDMLSAVKGDAAREIADYLPGLPSTTHLIFIESQTIAKNHFVCKALTQMQSATVKRYDDLKSRDVGNWVSHRVKHHHGEIEPRAARLLSQNIGANLRLLDQEIQKLLLYCGGKRRITAQDVQVMVPYVQSADVMFDMVDAIGTRNKRSAAQYLHRMLDTGSHPLAIYGMVVRQFRLLIQTRWLLDQRLRMNEITNALDLHPYVGEKVYGQAQRFSMQALRDAYDLLLDYDLAIKTGKVPPETALDLLIVQLAAL